MNKITKKFKQHTNRKHNPQHVNTKHRIINLSHKILTNEQMKVLKLGPQITMNQKTNRHKNAVIIEAEKAIRLIENKRPNTYRYLAPKRIKQIKEINKQIILHKKQYNIIKN